MNNNNLQVFNYNSNEIRTIVKNGEAWFVAKDVAQALGYERTADAIRKHVDSEDKGVSDLATPGGIQTTTIINEARVYSLIFSSKLQTAKQFKRWVTHDVLPDIRKHGMYISDKLREAAQVDKKAFDVVVNKYLTEKEKVKALEAQIADDRAFTVVGKTVLSMSGVYQWQKPRFSWHNME